jgi:hypothetical protein
MKCSLDQADRYKSFRVTPVKSVDQIFKKPNLISSVFEKAFRETLFIQPFTDLAGEMPLPDDHHHAKDQKDAHSNDQNIDRYHPRVVERKAP